MPTPLLSAGCSAAGAPLQLLDPHAALLRHVARHLARDTRHARRKPACERCRRVVPHRPAAETLTNIQAAAIAHACRRRPAPARRAAVGACRYP
jgi:hypothetical protein